MLYFDLMLFRIFTIGLISIILVAIFSLSRKSLTRQIRSVYLSILLIMPLFAFPLLITVQLPSDAPDWLMEIRLPDPAEQHLNQHVIGVVIEDIFTAEEPVSAEISSWLTEYGYKNDLGLSGLIVRLLPLIQLIYWAGLLLSLMINIILVIRRLRKRSRLCSSNAPDLNQSAWQAEIAGLRDEMGIYRKLDVVMAGQDENHVWAILQNWYRRRIPVPAGKPDAVDPSDRREWLIWQLRLNARPRIFMTIIWLIARSLLWFNPFIDFCFKSLIIDDLPKTGKVQEKRFNPIRIFVSMTVLFLLIGSLAMVGWQNPQQTTREFMLLKIEGAPELAVNILDQYPHRTKPLVSWIFDQKSDDYGFALLDAEGRPIWFVSGREIWDNSYLKDLSLLYVRQVNAVQMPDQSWSLIANMTRYNVKAVDEYIEMSDSAWHLHISHDGKLINVNKVVEHQMAQLISDRIVASALLLNDGSYLLTDRRSQSASLSSDINITLMTVNATTWFDADGKKQNSLDNNSWVNTFNRCYITKATRYGPMEFIAQNEIEQFIPIRDNLVGLLNTQGSISLLPSLNLKNQIQTDLDYQAQYRFICLDSNGHEVWQKNLTDLSDGIMIQNHYLSDGEMLYWQASRFDDYYSDVQSYSKTFTPIDTIIALNTANATSWKLRLDEKITGNFSIEHWIAQNDCLSLLLTGNNEDPNTLMICQLDHQGQLIGLVRLNNISDYYLYRIVEASPGCVSLYKYSGEGS